MNYLKDFQVIEDTLLLSKGIVDFVNLYDEVTKDFRYFPIISCITEDEITVGDLSLVGSKPKSLTISWKPPKVAAEVMYYVIEWHVLDKVLMECKVPNSTFRYVIGSLESCTTYTVKVMPRVESANTTRRVVTGTTGLDSEL